MQASDLTTSHIGNFEICVQQQVEAKRQIFAGVVDTNIEMQFFLSKYEPIGETEPVTDKHDMIYQL